MLRQINILAGGAFIALASMFSFYTTVVWCLDEDLDPRTTTVAIAFAFLIDGGKLMAFWGSSLLVNTRWFSFPRITTNAVSIILVLISCFASSAYLKSIDAKKRQAYNESVAAYDANQQQITDKRKLIAEKRTAATALSLRFRDTRAKELESEINELSTQIDLLIRTAPRLSQSPVNASVINSMLGMHLSLDRCYDMIAFIIEWLPRFGLMVLIMYIRQTKKAEQSETAPRLGTVSTVSIRTEDGLYNRVCGLLLSGGIEPNYGAMQKALKVGRSKLTPLFELLVAEKVLIRTATGRYVLAPRDDDKKGAASNVSFSWWRRQSAKKKLMSET